MIFDFTNPIDFQSFVSQIESFLKNKDVLKQVAFDVFDFNNDGKITDIDLFKVFSYFSKGSYQQMFETALQMDLILLTKEILVKKSAREEQEEEQHMGYPGEKAYDKYMGLDRIPSEVQRRRYFRNVNVTDYQFESKRKQLFNPMYKIKKMVESGPHWGAKILQL